VCRTLGLRRVPHYSTLCYAAHRLLAGAEKRGTFRRAQQVIVARAAQQGLLAPPAIAAVDATGLEARHASVHYRSAHTRAYRTAYATLHGGVTPATAHDRATYPKRTRVVHPRSHLIAGALHRLCREELGMRATAIALHRRRARHRWPPTPYRRAMRRAFPRALYGERQQVESVISRAKRRLGAALTARQRATQAAEQVLRVLTYHLLLLYRARDNLSTKPLSTAFAC
jgi:hypothetical protein